MKHYVNTQNKQSSLLKNRVLGTVFTATAVLAVLSTTAQAQTSLSNSGYNSGIVLNNSGSLNTGCHTLQVSTFKAVGDKVVKATTKRTRGVLGGSNGFDVGGGSPVLGADCYPVGPSGPKPETKPTAAVSMGDSFISGEGAGDYVAVENKQNVLQGFPGWDHTNENAYFCHRSENAFIHEADLPGIDDRFNVACSGAKPIDFTEDSHMRNVKSQIAQLQKINETHDIDLIVIGLGANNDYYGFAPAIEKCVFPFLTDGVFTVAGLTANELSHFSWLRGYEASDESVGPHEAQAACTFSDIVSSQADINAAALDYENAVRDVILAMTEMEYSGTDYKIILNGYVSPVAYELDAKFNSETGKYDSDNLFQNLVSERWSAGCPMHKESLVTAEALVNTLSDLSSRGQAAINKNPAGLDVPHIIKLDLTRSFDGVQLCADNEPTADGKAAVPIRIDTLFGGNYVKSSNWIDFSAGTIGFEGPFWDLVVSAQRCNDKVVKRYHLCQESLHPSAYGHRLLGKCIAGAYQSSADRVKCRRIYDNDNLSVSALNPRLTMNTAHAIVDSPNTDGTCLIAVGFASTFQNNAGYTVSNYVWSVEGAPSNVYASSGSMSFTSNKCNGSLSISVRADYKGNQVVNSTSVMIHNPYNNDPSDNDDGIPDQK